MSFHPELNVLEGAPVAASQGRCFSLPIDHSRAQTDFPSVHLGCKDGIEWQDLTLSYFPTVPDFQCVRVTWGAGFYAPEGQSAGSNLVWASSSEADIRVENCSGASRTVTLDLTLMSAKPRTVRLSRAEKTEEHVLDETHLALPVRVSLDLKPGTNTLHLSTDVPPDYPSNSRVFKVGFGIFKLSLRDQP